MLNIPEYIIDLFKSKTILVMVKFYKLTSNIWKSMQIWWNIISIYNKLLKRHEIYEKECKTK